MKDRIDLSKYANLFKDLKAQDIMTRQVITMGPEKKMVQAKEMMKLKKISGIPVVDQQGRLLGIVSIQDIIVALEFNRIREPLKNMMSTQVSTLNIEDSLMEIVGKFECFKFGRFPVIDDQGVVRGIISREDILHGVLERFNLIYTHDEKRRLKLDSDHSLVTGQNLAPEAASFHYAIDTSDINSAGIGSATLKQFVLSKGCPADIARRIGIASYEAECNVVIHSKGEGELLCFLLDDSIIVRVIDNGIGIEDLEIAMKEGFSTAPDYIREIGFGAGMGIPNMKAFADKLVIISEKNVGTQVEMVFYLQEKQDQTAQNSTG